MLQTHAPAILFSHRFRFEAFSTVCTNTLCMRILFFFFKSTRTQWKCSAYVYQERTQTKNILYVNQYKIVGGTAHHLALPSLNVNTYFPTQAKMLGLGRGAFKAILISILKILGICTPIPSRNATSTLTFSLRPKSGWVWGGESRPSKATRISKRF